MEELNACEDKPRITDYEYEELFGSSFAIKPPFPIKELTVQNQRVPGYTMSCTRQGLSHITNGNNILEGIGEDQRLAFNMWDEFVKTNPSAIKDGASLQSTLDQFLAHKKIAGYSKVTTVEQGKASIDSGRFIYTGSSNGDWVSVRDFKLYKLRTDGKKVGHCFCIIGYDDKGFIGLNSYGPTNGYFTIPFGLFTTLFTRYAISDFIDKPILELKKKVTMEDILKKAVELGVFNGKELDKPASRQEIAVMLMRVYNLLNK